MGKRQAHNLIGGPWLARLLIWAGVLLMVTGGVVAYPTLQAAIVPPDPEGLEFSVTLTPAFVRAVPQSPTNAPTAAVSEMAKVTSPLRLDTTPLPLPTMNPTAQAASGTAAEVTAEQETAMEPAEKRAATPTTTPAPTAAPTATPTPTSDPADLIPNRVVIPAINLDAPVWEVGWETKEINGEKVSTWIVPDAYAAGWHKTSALPGELGNTVLNGHHNIYGEVFRYLVDLQPGDRIILYTNQGAYTYAVTERHILKEKYASPEIRKENARFIQPTEDERLTLITCWPYTNNTHRLIIVALPVGPTPTPAFKGE